MPHPAFLRYIGIDYSGAQVPNASLKGLRVYCSGHQDEPAEVLPPPGPKKYWTRRGVAEWLAERLAEDIPTLVGIDHSFSFPLRYFETHRIPQDWDIFLDDFQKHWPTDEDNVYVDFVRDGLLGNAAARSGNRRWRRLSELRCGGKSVFHFDVQGSVAKSTHSGIPWLRFLRRQQPGLAHFWPFDGWQLPVGRSAIVEAYPALYKHAYPSDDRTPDQHDAFSVARWLREADHSGELARVLSPRLTEQERAIAQIEGWIIGVG